MPLWSVLHIERPDHGTSWNRGDASILISHKISMITLRAYHFFESSIRLIGNGRPISFDNPSRNSLSQLRTDGAPAKPPMRNKLYLIIQRSDTHPPLRSSWIYLHYMASFPGGLKLLLYYLSNPSKKWHKNCLVIPTEGPWMLVKLTRETNLP